MKSMSELHYQTRPLVEQPTGSESEGEGEGESEKDGSIT